MGSSNTSKKGAHTQIQTRSSQWKRGLAKGVFLRAVLVGVFLALVCETGKFLQGSGRRARLTATPSMLVGVEMTQQSLRPCDAGEFCALANHPASGAWCCRHDTRRNEEDYSGHESSSANSVYRTAVTERTSGASLADFADCARGGCNGSAAPVTESFEVTKGALWGDNNTAIGSRFILMDSLTPSKGTHWAHSSR